MAVIGKILKNRRAGQDGLAWNAPNLAAPDTMTLRSPDFTHEAVIPTVHAATRLGGQDLSPALAWSPTPEGTAQVLLVIEDPDAPTATPFIHCVALLDPAVTDLPQGALPATAGTRVRRPGTRPRPPGRLLRTPLTLEQCRTDR